MSDETKPLQAFLDERISMKRKSTNRSLQIYSACVIDSIVRLGCQQEHIDLVAKNMTDILNDCEIFFNMPHGKAFDALAELSNWASLFFGSEKYDHIYTRICILIKNIGNSYTI